MLMRSVLSLCGLSLFSIFSPACSASGADGVIHFVGSVVEDSCDFSHNQRRVMVDCPVGSRRVKQSIAVADINTANIASNVPATVQLRYLDDSKKLAVLSVVYR